MSVSNLLPSRAIIAAAASDNFLHFVGKVLADGGVVAAAAADAIYLPQRFDVLWLESMNGMPRSPDAFNERR